MRIRRSRTCLRTAGESQHKAMFDWETTKEAVRYTKVYEFLEAEGFTYTIELPTNAVLQEHIDNLLKLPVGRPASERPGYM